MPGASPCLGVACSGVYPRDGVPVDVPAGMAQLEGAAAGLQERGVIPLENNPGSGNESAGFLKQLSEWPDKCSPLPPGCIASKLGPPSASFWYSPQEHLVVVWRNQ